MKILPVIKTDRYNLPIAERCKSSWDYFHPDIPMHIVVWEDWYAYICEMHQTPNIDKVNMSMTVGLFYAIQKIMVEKYELLIYLDGDTVVTGRCDELLSEDYDIAVSRSSDEQLVKFNAGVWASRDLEFIKHFYYTRCVSPVDDNAVFIYHVENYKWYQKDKTVKVLDADESGVWYNERSREWWNRLGIRDGKLYTPDKQIKILHWAGGTSWGWERRMSCSLFSDEVKQWLNKITNGTTFTDYDGKEYGEFIKNHYKL
jgi:hypothetical protein